MKSLMYFLFGFLIAAILGGGLYYFKLKKHCEKENFEQINGATAQKYADKFKEDFPKVKSDFYVSKDFIHTGKQALYSLKGDEKKIYGFKISYGLIKEGDSARIVAIFHPIIRYNEMLNVTEMYMVDAGKVERKSLPCPPFCDRIGPE